MPVTKLTNYSYLADNSAHDGRKVKNKNMSVNKVILVGNVGRDPEVRYLDGGQQGQQTKVATFTLATSERYRDRSGELRENTEWHNIVAWRQSADICERFVKKGTQLYIEGKLRTRSYSDATGNKKYTTEVVVDSLQLLGRREGETPSQGAYAQPAYQQPAKPAYQAPAQAAQPIDINLDSSPSDDLPF